MSMDYNNITIENNKYEQRYQVEIDRQIAVLTYERDGNDIIFLHTGVPEALEGHGIANKLTRQALEDARAENLTVIPACPFVASYMRRHPEYLSLLTESEQKRVQEGRRRD